MCKFPIQNCIPTYKLLTILPSIYERWASRVSSHMKCCIYWHVFDVKGAMILLTPHRITGSMILLTPHRITGAMILLTPHRITGAMILLTPHRITGAMVKDTASASCLLPEICFATESHFSFVINIAHISSYKSISSRSCRFLILKTCEYKISHI